MELFEVAALLLFRGCRLRSLFHPNCGIWVDGGFAGSIGCHAIDWANRNCSLGYWVDATHQDKGIATKCCASILHYFFEELDLQRVVIQCATGNTRSCAIPERLGFTREGVNREAELVGRRAPKANHNSSPNKIKDLLE
jgi:RimJ/RimL family protein N-acetyltransferase